MLTDGWTEGRKIGRLYRTLLQAGVIKIKKKIKNKKLKGHLLQFVIASP